MVNQVVCGEKGVMSIVNIFVNLALMNKYTTPSKNVKQEIFDQFASIYLQKEHGYARKNELV